MFQGVGTLRAAVRTIVVVLASRSTAATPSMENQPFFYFSFFGESIMLSSCATMRPAGSDGLPVYLHPPARPSLGTAVFPSTVPMAYKNFIPSPPHASAASPLPWGFWSALPPPATTLPQRKNEPSSALSCLAGMPRVYLGLLEDLTKRVLGACASAGLRRPRGLLGWAYRGGTDPCERPWA